MTVWKVDVGAAEPVLRMKPRGSSHMDFDGASGQFRLEG